MEKTEWPTKEHLKELREEGTICYSSSATRAFVAGALLVLVLVSYRDIIASFNEYFYILKTSPESVDLYSFLKDCLNRLFGALAIVSVAALSFGFLQTRFFIKPSNIRFNIDYLSPPREKLRLSKRLIFAVVFSLCALSGWILLLALSLFAFASHFHQRAETFFALNAKFMIDVVAWYSGCAFLCAVLFYIYEEFSFRLRNKMSRQELEQQMREEG